MARVTLLDGEMIRLGATPPGRVHPQGVNEDSALGPTVELAHNGSAQTETSSVATEFATAGATRMALEVGNAIESDGSIA